MTPTYSTPPQVKRHPIVAYEKGVQYSPGSFCCAYSFVLYDVSLYKYNIQNCIQLNSRFNRQVFSVLEDQGTKFKVAISNFKYNFI